MQTHGNQDPRTQGGRKPLERLNPLQLNALRLALKKPYDRGELELALKAKTSKRVHQGETFSSR